MYLREFQKNQKDFSFEQFVANYKNQSFGKISRHDFKFS